jgi:acetamidase/formamidase
VSAVATGPSSVVMKQVLPSPTTVHWGFFDAALPPIAEVASGETFHLRSVSGSPDDPVPSGWVPPEIPEIYAKVRKDVGPHILTGPVYVRGARPGGVLQVDIIDIQLGALYGNNILVPLKGLFPDDVTRFERKVVPIDLASGIATVPPGIKLQTRPFFGILGVAPPAAWGRIDSAAPRAHGGNLDNKELIAGTTYFQPVWNEGALFSAGDGHGAQGDGEVCITAIEMSLEGEFRVTAREDFELELPIALTPSHLITMGFDEDLDRAARIAIRSMLKILEMHCGVSWSDGYRLASLAVDLRITQVVNGVKGVHAMLPRELLEQMGRPVFRP